MARGIFRRLNPKSPRDADDFYRPILGLVTECGGDGDRVWQLMESQHDRMVSDGLTVQRAGPVVAQIFTEWKRAALPPPQSQADEPERVGGVY